MLKRWVVLLAGALLLGGCAAAPAAGPERPAPDRISAEEARQALIELTREGRYSVLYAPWLETAAPVGYGSSINLGRWICDLEGKTFAVMLPLGLHTNLYEGVFERDENRRWTARVTAEMHLWEYQGDEPE